LSDNGVNNKEKIADLARWFKESREAVIFTGAGISTESGISDFRSPGGVWDRYNPDELSYPRFISNESSRRYYWKFYHEYWTEARDVKPNRGHLALAKLDALCNISAIITQNIDGLHQKAGHDQEKIYELHGNMWRVSCLNCSDIYDWEDFYKLLEEGKDVYNCRLCGGFLKPSTISFGQSLPMKVLQDAQRASNSCDLFLCIGSSLVVYPAAQLPQQAKRDGAKLVIINREPTALDGIADLIIRGEAGDILSEVVATLEKN